MSSIQPAKTVRIGFLINPIAGMGGRVGLKGTDGEILQRAMELGAKPVAIARARAFLDRLQSEIADLRKDVTLVTCSGVMGSGVTSKYDFQVELISYLPMEKTTAKDTNIVCRELISRDISLLVFVGGDGTAKDVCNSMKSFTGQVPGIIGVPSGVKMYSGIFAVTPGAAAEIIRLFILGEADNVAFEIMDADEEQFRSDNFSIKLFGYLLGPYVPLKVQGAKQISPASDNEQENQLGVARFTVETLGKGSVLLGPGTTTKEVASLLGKKKTLLGVDLYIGHEEFLDINESQILKNPKFDPAKTWIVVSPIGRQGIIFGRGNQQISPQIIKAILEEEGKDRIIVAATKSKLASFEGGKLRVDTGNNDVDQMLRGYLKVITDYREWRLVEVS